MSRMHSGNVFLFLLQKNFIVTSSVVVDRELLHGFEPMKASYKVSHDWELWLRIARRLPIYGIPDILGELRIQEGSAISSVHTRRVESRRILRDWKGQVPMSRYSSILAYYYLMEVLDVIPRKISAVIRRAWYMQSRFKGAE